MNAPKGAAAVYGLVLKVPDKTLVSEFLIHAFNALYTFRRESL